MTDQHAEGAPARTEGAPARTEGAPARTEDAPAPVEGGSAPAEDAPVRVDGSDGSAGAAAEPDPVTETEPDSGGDRIPEAAGPSSLPTDARRPRPRRRVVLLAIIAVAVLVVDIVTKVIVVATITPGENPRILGGLVYFSLIRNSGAAFSMATGMTWVLALVAIGVVAFIIRMAPRMRSTPWAVCLGLILGGALGNLTDRIFRSPGVLRGHVVDFVSLFGPNAEYFPAFNAADSAITIGGVLLVIITLLGYDFDGSRHVRKAKRPADG